MADIKQGRKRKDCPICGGKMWQYSKKCLRCLRGNFRRNAILDMAPRFYSYVKRSGANRCWKWVGTKMKNGYGVFGVGGHKQTTILAHRMALALSGTFVPINKCVCHSCDSRDCVNPAHLWLGSYKENLSDMENKGRGWWQK